ncbi:hypothetical protein L2E82_30354 [Cichorium intybus]|uniref:Uncharacterized protein n=1 Tax=Cichorium intybus TaxID=13427 RepID=A0ACB9D0H1_CICIN|nr:hypothetical protein L2E82_30354 [Cichorium intybus]
MEQTRSGSMDVKGDFNVGNPTFRRSFKEVVSGANGGGNNDARMDSMEIRIPDSIIVDSQEWLNSCLIGELKDLDLLAKCFSILHSTGIGDCSDDGDWNPPFSHDAKRFNFDYEDDSGNGVPDTCDSDEQEDEYNSHDDDNGDDCNSIHGDGRVPESSLVGNNVVENNSIDAEGLSKGEDEQPSNGNYESLST